METCFCFGPKCFLASAFILLTILSIYGIIGALLNYEQLSKLPTFGEWPFNLRPIFGAFIFVQLLYPVAGLFGLIAGCKSQPMWIYGSGSVLLAIFTCCSVFGCVSLRVNQLDIEHEFYASVKNNRNHSRVIDWMNDVQWQHKCCGVYSFHDWYQFGEDDSVPSSCCKRDIVAPRATCGERILTEVATSPTFNAGKLIHTQGCGKNVSSIVQNASRRLGTEIVLAGGVSFIVAIFLYICTTKLFLKKKRAPSLKRKMDANGNIIDGNHEQSPSASVATRGGATTEPSRKTLDANNNNNANSLISRKEFQRQRLVEKRRRRMKERQNSSRIRQQFSPGIRSQSKFSGKGSENEINGNTKASKSFILGEAQSHLLASIDLKEQDLIRKNVDMLWYQSVEKNMSTLSTTPIDSSYFTFPSNFQSKRHMLTGDGTLNEEEHRNTVYTLVSERPFTPSLSQNCSVSIFGSNPGKVLNGNGEASPNTKQRQVLQPLNGELTEESEPESTPAHATSTQGPTHTSSPNAPGVTTQTTNVDEKHPVIKEEEEVVEEESANQASDSPPLSSPGGKYVNPTSSVRSSTLATIQEESESTKGSPAPTKAASPASGYMSPVAVSPRQTETDLTSQQHKHNVAKDNVAQYPGNEKNIQNISNNNTTSGGDNQGLVIKAEMPAFPEVVGSNRGIFNDVSVSGGEGQQA